MSRLDETRTSTTRDDYETPDMILDLVREAFGGTIALDPATSESNPTKALAYYTAAVDGLSRSWTFFPNWFCNPPYGRALRPWAEKAIYMYHTSCQGIMLTPCRPDTEWYDILASNATAIAEVRGRLKFKGCVQSAQFPSALFYFGHNPNKFCEVFSKIARCRTVSS